ncbi:MAG: adenylate/guanylate cyclase domain-containing protein, partial [Saprospiraceae bacterium]|nr:adenylate/guanylate cyclase domain-containing protein [Saprospiraceae bacterium]
TFVFSDIEHSTQLAQQLREDYPELLERHRSVIRDAIQAHSGKEIDTAGDGFFMTFDDPRYAVLAAAEIQREFHTQEWATKTGLKVRMGIHTGIALSTESGFTGVEVHCASRVCDAAHGGQVLISEATERYLKVGVEDELTLSGLGDYVFKDFSYPIELFQLNIPGVDRQFPQPRINPNEQKIVILPFSNEGTKSEDEYIGDGMAEEIIVALGKVRGLRVISRSTAFALKDEDLDARQVGQKLEVDSVLEGRVKSNNGQMQISVELIATDSGLNIWSGKYDSAKDHLVSIQDEITSKITKALGCTLVNEQMHSIQQRQTHNAEAYDYYLRGRRFYWLFSSRGIELALQMFERAIENDSTYALAYAGLADCYSFQFLHKSRSQEIIDKADAASRRAIELAPELAEVFVSRGIVMSLRGKFQEAENSFQYAIERDPTLFLGWFHYARNCFASGKLDKAARLFEQANRVEPDDYQSILLSAQAYDDIGCSDLASTLRQRGVAIADKWLELNPGDTRALYLAANALVFLDQQKKSLTYLQRALSLEPNDSMLLYNAGCVYALLDMKQEALSCLERSYAAGLTMKGWYENDSNLDSLRDDPRFGKLLEHIKAESA